MQFGVAAGEKDEIRLRCGGLVGQRRERQHVGPRRPPVSEDMRIGKGKGPVGGHRDPLAGRGEPDGRSRRGQGRGQRRERVEIDRRLGQRRDPVEPAVEVVALARLDEAEMTRGLDEPRLAVERA